MADSPQRAKTTYQDYLKLPGEQRYEVLEGDLQMVPAPGVPHQKARVRGVKRRPYGRYGVQEYWLVDPQERTVEVACLRDGALETVSLEREGTNVRTLLFPDLVLPVHDLFRQA